VYFNPCTLIVMMKSKLFASVVFAVLFLTSHLVQAGVWDTVLIRGTQVVLRHSLLRPGMQRVGVNGINDIYNPVIQNGAPIFRVPQYAYVTVTGSLLQDNNNNPGDETEDDMGAQMNDDIVSQVRWWVDYFRDGNPYPENIGQRTEMFVNMALAELSLRENDEEKEPVLEDMDEAALLENLMDTFRLADDPVQLIRNLELEVLDVIPDWLFVQAAAIRNRLVAGSPADFFFELMRRRNRCDDYAMLATWYRVAEEVRLEVQRAILVRNAVDGLIEQAMDIDGLRALYYDSIESVLDEMTGAWDTLDLLKAVQGTVLEPFVQWVVSGNLGGLASHQDIMGWNAYFEEHVFPVIGDELEAALKKMGKGKKPKAKKKKKAKKKRTKKVVVLAKE